MLVVFSPRGVFKKREITVWGLYGTDEALALGETPRRGFRMTLYKGP